MQAAKVDLPTFERPTLVAWMTHMTVLPLEIYKFPIWVQCQFLGEIYQFMQLT